MALAEVLNMSLGLGARKDIGFVLIQVVEKMRQRVRLVEAEDELGTSDE
jgi:hypothetical protein